MNRLKLVQKFQLEAVQGNSLIASTINQSGMAARLVGWIDDAWINVQRERGGKWYFLWEEASILLPAGAYENTTQGIPDGRYITDETANFAGSYCQYIPWADFAVNWPLSRIIAAPNNESSPSNWTVLPNRVVRFSGKPTTNRTFYVQRYKNPTPLADGNDEVYPIAEEHINLILWNALLRFGGFDESGNVFTYARAQYQNELNKTLKAETPSLQFGGPLA